MNPIIIKFTVQTASVIVSTLISYGVIVAVEHTVEGVRRWYYNRKEQTQTNTENS